MTIRQYSWSIYFLWKFFIWNNGHVWYSDWWNTCRFCWSLSASLYILLLCRGLSVGSVRSTVRDTRWTIHLNIDKVKWKYVEKFKWNVKYRDKNIWLRLEKSNHKHAYTDNTFRVYLCLKSFESESEYFYYTECKIQNDTIDCTGDLMN